nr:MAG: hydroxylase-like protein [Enquatrovirus sp.]
MKFTLLNQTFDSKTVTLADIEFINSNLGYNHGTDEQIQFYVTCANEPSNSVPKKTFNQNTYYTTFKDYYEEVLEYALEEWEAIAFYVKDGVFYYISSDEEQFFIDTYTLSEADKSTLRTLKHEFGQWEVDPVTYLPK